MGSRGIAITNLALRIFTLLVLAASIVVMATNSFKNDDGSKTSFKDFIAYRYVIATAMIGFVYTAFQIPFAMYHVCKDHRIIRNGCLPEFDFYGDKIISFLLATGVGAGFAVTFELKRLLDDFLELVEQLDGEKSKASSFLDRANIATAILFLGFISMAILSILSSMSRSAATTKDSNSSNKLKFRTCFS